MTEIHTDNTTAAPLTCVARAPTGSATLPLFVDLDGTLIKTDLLAESALELLTRKPWFVFAVFFWLLHGGRARLKAELARRVTPSTDTIPYQMQFVEYLRAEAAGGRTLYLATASDRRLAEPVASELGVFADILASDGATNLKGHQKLEAILATTDGDDFAYAGNGRADLTVWRKAVQAVVVNPSMGVAKAAERECRVVRVFDDRPASWRAWLRAARLYQWPKNLLLFVPVVTAHAFDRASLASVGFFAFGFVASATYILNDLLDLHADRLHPRKRRRPFAAGDIPIAHGLVALVVLLGLGLLLAAVVSTPFLLVLSAYLVLTVAYSNHVKQYVLIDVLVLATLYTVRIIAGAVAIEVELSSWLLAFSIFLFYSLALLKRSSELATLAKQGVEAASRRDYRVSDSAALNTMGIASGYMAVLVLALFIDSDNVRQHYSRPELLWLLCPAVLYWTSRLWMKTARGEMHDDPLIYSLRDRASWVVLLSMLAIAILAV